MYENGNVIGIGKGIRVSNSGHVPLRAASGVFGLETWLIMGKDRAWGAVWEKGSESDANGRALRRGEEVVAMFKGDGTDLGEEGNQVHRVELCGEERDQFVLYSGQGTRPSLPTLRCGSPHLGGGNRGTYLAGSAPGPSCC